VVGLESGLIHVLSEVQSNLVICQSDNPFGLRTKS